MSRFHRLLACALTLVASAASAHPPNIEESPTSDEPLAAATRFGAATRCSGGFAGPYPCKEVDLLAFLPNSSIGGEGGAGGNDIWGWTDSQTGKEYALMGLTNGTSFVDISHPKNPRYLGHLPSQSVSSAWRDIKTYADHAFVVSEASNQGMQVFDLTRLRNVWFPKTFTPDTTYMTLTAHNIVINEDTGFAYLVGSNTCSGGLHMVDISNPTSPTFAGCFSGDGYTHDAQCVSYDGPDSDYAGSEICFASNEDTITIVDVTNKASPFQVSRTGYPGSAYTNQGWLTEDHRYFLLADELDESSFGHNTKTYVWDMTDLDSPIFVGSHFSGNPAIDHNLYVHGDFAFQANYRSGLRILELIDLTTASLSEVAYFDIYPEDDDASFNGAWGCYPFFASGVVIVSGIEQGLFILERATLADCPFEIVASDRTVIAGPDGAKMVATADAVRDKVLRGTPGGDHLIQLFYEEKTALARAALLDSEVRRHLASLMREVSDGLDALARGDAAESAAFTISTDAVTHLEELLRVLVESDPDSDLARTIRAERRKLDLEELAGMSFAEALAHAEDRLSR